MGGHVPRRRVEAEARHAGRGNVLDPGLVSCGSRSGGGHHCLRSALRQSSATAAISASPSVGDGLMMAVSNAAEMAVLTQSATGREVTDRNRATSMSPISVPQVLHAAMAIQYQGLLSPYW